MTSRVIAAGFAGFVALALWTFVVNGLVGFRARIDMNRLPEERRVYELLRDVVTTPGRYIVNPEVTGPEGYPLGEPVFSLSYAGFGHEAAGRLALLHVVVGFLATTLVAAMLSVASPRVLSSFPKKVLFFTGAGCLLALFHDIPAHGIGGYPFGPALLLAADDIASWTVVGLAAAWWLKPERRTAG